MTTWSNFNKSSSITITGSGLVAEVTGNAVGWKGVKTSVPVVGKYAYCEITVNKGLSTDILIGVSPEGFPLDCSFPKLYKGSTLSAACSDNASSIYITGIEDWPESGIGVIFDSSNNVDYVSWASRGASIIFPNYIDHATQNLSVRTHLINAKIFPISEKITSDVVTMYASGYCGVGHLWKLNNTAISANSFTLGSPGHDYTTPASNLHNFSDIGWGDTFREGDVISIAVDTLHGDVWFAKNGTWQKSGNPGSLSNPALCGQVDDGALDICVYMRTLGNKVTANFGSSPFLYSVPTGFVPLDNVLYEYHISGVMTKLGSPVDRTVLLLDRTDTVLVGVVTSDAVTGAYLFDKVRGDHQYCILGLPSDLEVNSNTKAIDHAVAIPN